jgi:hypothetical protein
MTLGVCREDPARFSVNPPQLITRRQNREAGLDADFRWVIDNPRAISRASAASDAKCDHPSG